MTIGRLYRVAAVAGLALLLAPLSAMAQSPTWTVSNAEAEAGSEVVLNLILSDTTLPPPDSTGIAGANLTVRLDNNDLLTFQTYDGTHYAEKGSTVASWQMDENLVSATELRVVLYDSNTPPQALGAGTDVTLVQVHLLINGAASVGANAQVHLDLGVDGSVTPNVGLTRLSNANGESFLPGASSGTVTVAQPAYPPVVFDFSGGQLDWSVIQIRETFDASGSPPFKVVNPGVAIGLKVTKTNDTFGFYSSTPDAIPPVPNDDMLVRANWLLSSSSADPADAPAVRLRFNSADYTVAESLEVTSPNDVSGGRLSPGTTPKIISEYFVQATSTRNGVGTDGYQASFDLMAFDPNYTGPLDSAIWLHQLEVEATALDTSSPTPVAAFNYDFSASGTDTQNWNGIVIPTLYGLDGVGFPNTIVAEADNGLILRSENTLTAPPDYKFSFAFWTSPQFALVGGADKLYRLKMNIASTTANPVQTPHFRIRLNSADSQWARSFEVIRKDIDSSMAPSASGTDYYVYFNYPAELNGVAVSVSVDQINERAEDDNNGSFKLVRASLEELPMPTYN